MRGEPLPDELAESYRILDIDARATFDEVRAAYRRRVKEWHPDRFTDNVLMRSAAEERLREINVAFEWIRRSGLHEGTPTTGAAEETEGSAAAAKSDSPQHRQAHPTTESGYRIIHERVPDRDASAWCPVPGCDLEPRWFSTGWGYVNGRGYVMIPGQFGAALPFGEGLAAVGSGKFASLAKYGYINPSGEWVIPVQFDDARVFSCGRAAVRMHQRWGYIDRQGKVVVPYRLQAATDFSEGLAAVKEGGLWGYLDIQGRYLVTPRFDRAGHFLNGFAVAELKGRKAKVSASGEIALYAAS